MIRLSTEHHAAGYHMRTDLQRTIVTVIGDLFEPTGFECRVEGIKDFIIIRGDKLIISI